MAAIALAYVGSELGAAIGWSIAADSAISVGTLGMIEAGGGMIGQMVGSSIDRAIFGPGGQSAQGPRLSDLTVQSSADGAAMPVVFGTARIAGNVIWSTGLTETSNTQSSGGGSGGGGSSYTTYTYSTDAAIALCEGTITGIRRIWADSKLIYDVSTTASVGTLVASASQASAIRIYGRTFYLPSKP